MTNYRIQDACQNCSHLIRNFSLYEGPDTLYCDRIKLAERPVKQVAENGICDDYEKRLPQPKTEATNTNEIPL